MAETVAQIDRWPEDEWERRRAELAWATATRSDLEAARDHAARALADELRRWR